MPDNAPTPPLVRERLDDVRPIVVASRVAIYAALPALLFCAIVDLCS